MGQVLVKEHGKLDIDQTFVEGEIPATQAMIGGQRIMLTEGRPAKPIIHRRGTAFFYDDGSPVTRAEDVEHLPERCRVDGRVVNVREMALRFVERHQAAAADASPPRGAGRGGVVVRATDNPRRLRHRAASPRRVIEVKGSQVLGPRGGTRPERIVDPDRQDI